MLSSPNLPEDRRSRAREANRDRNRREEGGEHACLDVIPGTVRRFPEGLTVPHMGWNQVRQVSPHPFFEGVPDGAHFYFVHSY